MNYFVVCPDSLGLSLLLPRVLEKLASREDIHFLQASHLTKEKARQMEKEARKAPSGMSNHTYFCISLLQNLAPDSVGPLLKVVEESKYANFIFQAQTITRETRTLLSRSMVIRLSFMSKAMVLGNMQAMHLDAATADELGLYDGTLGGTIKALTMKDTVVEIRREIRRGVRGIVALQREETVQSLALHTAISPFLREGETAFLKEEDSPERRRLVLFMLAERGH